MTQNTSAYVVAQLRALAERQAAQLKDRPAVVPPSEQMRRFLSGEEFARVERGEVTPTQYHEYQREMLRRLGEEG